MAHQTLHVPVVPEVLEGLLLVINILIKPWDLTQNGFAVCRHPMRTGMRTRIWEFLNCDEVDAQMLQQQ
jgi:hypothetical protein